MKTSVIFLLLFVIAGSTFAAEPTKSTVRKKRVMPEFYVSGSTLDKSLDNNHSVFELQFSQLLLNEMEVNVLQRPLIELSCNGVIRLVELDSTLKTSIIVSPGKYIFQLAVKNGSYNEIFSDSILIEPRHITTCRINFRAEDMREMLLKPVIYVYSPTDQVVNLELKPKGDFTFTYPPYTNSGWNGMAHPDGSFTINDKTYPYLFWEGADNQVDQLADYSNGFVVKQAEVTTFLEEKLSQMGLNDKEKTDFITFWGPRMIQAEQGFVQFIFNKDYDQLASISISPAPQELFRVYMLWTPLENATELNPQPQKIESGNRSGFYVIEWGGSELIYHPILSSYE